MTTPSDRDGDNQRLLMASTLFHLRGLPWSNRIMDFVPPVDVEDLDILSNLDCYQKSENQGDSEPVEPKNDSDRDYDFVFQSLRSAQDEDPS